MGTNTFAPFGLRPSQNSLASSPTYQAFGGGKLAQAYTTAISLFDLVNTVSTGYVQLASGTYNLGVFGGCQPFYDSAQQATIQPQYWSGKNSPNADVPIFVYNDPFMLYEVQVSGGPWAQSWQGMNINILSGTNGVPNTSGMSTLAVDANSIATTGTLPFRIYGLANTLPGGPYDPTFTNPVILVRLNTSETLRPTGV